MLNLLKIPCRRYIWSLLTVTAIFNVHVGQIVKCYYLHPIRKDTALHYYYWSLKRLGENRLLWEPLCLLEQELFSSKRDIIGYDESVCQIKIMILFLFLESSWILCKTCLVWLLLASFLPPMTPSSGKSICNKISTPEILQCKERTGITSW